MTGRPLSPADTRRLLHEAIDAVQPAPDALKRILDGYRRRRRTRRIQGAMIGALAVACATVAVIAVPLAARSRVPGRHAVTPALASQPASAAALAAAIRAGQQAERSYVGAPVAGFGTIGPAAAWVLDGYGLFITADAGVRWARITPPVSDPLANILGVTFRGPDDGWAIVVHPEAATIVSIDRSADGGRSWQSVSLPAAGDSIGGASISFVTESVGFAVINRFQQPHALVFASSDGGAHWHLITGTAPPVGSGIEFTSAADGWGVSTTGQLYQTTDGGLTWSKPQLPGFEPHGSGANANATGSASLPTFFGDRGVLLVRGPGTVVPLGPTLVETTVNGGRSWQSRALPFDPDAQAYESASQMPFTATSPGTWLYFGSSDFGGRSYAKVTFLRVTADSGGSWTTLLPDLGLTGVQSLAFATGSSGWAVLSTCGGSGCENAGGLLLFTGDGGRHFVPVRPPG